ncbi:MAG TPA: prolyl oligopeptidase family serine peptidase, partial [Planctomycetota bacterium]|nr:prolyl oligopeptidase family serine peptidase [Planctomycetota bacterium]
MMLLMRKLTAFLVMTLVVLSWTTPVGAQDWPGKTRDWNGFVRHDFRVDGRACYVVKPEHPAPGRPWVWRARFPEYHKDADLLLLERGFHIAFVDTNGMLGSPRAMQHWDAFYDFVTRKGLAKRVALHGVSRGGLFVYAFAARHPSKVACIYADTPVCSLKSWPGGKGRGRGDAATWQALLDEYGFTEQEALAYDRNPVDTLAPLAQAEIPILHIVSLNDAVVPPDENSFVVVERYRELGGTIDVIEVQQGTEASHGHHFDHPDVLRVADFIERHATALPKDADYVVARGRLDNSRITFETTGKGRVAFVGGSITQNPGWRDRTKDYLRARFPRTSFDFIDAGLASTGSTPGAFRLARDALGHGKVDLLFEEAAVNDLHNMRSDTEMTRAMEGILRHARTANPAMDILVLHFVDPKHMRDYRAGETPNVIAVHEAVVGDGHRLVAGR